MGQRTGVPPSGDRKEFIDDCIKEFDKDRRQLLEVFEDLNDSS